MPSRPRSTFASPLSRSSFSPISNVLHGKGQGDHKATGKMLWTMYPTARSSNVAPSPIPHVEPNDQSILPKPRSRHSQEAEHKLPWHVYNPGTITTAATLI
ncbi:hypothetical protein BOTBODRAFT_170620 [Botryobasidium botryosum FD-172 SS1]|uniref:Uncharacterized protein n=1 Tax=Botryobasidium botryosum (strain FD-172 SS1) TaxID=930990 RepID=A0A067MXV7_BOTB1|nr:hypothetical protein BOTBODRAFT_170620 [Botryobasidium botryosum FD-172 SS1]